MLLYGTEVRLRQVLLLHKLDFDPVGVVITWHLLLLLEVLQPRLKGL